MIPRSSPPFLDAVDWDDSLEQDPDAQHIVGEAWSEIDDRLQERSRYVQLKVQHIIGWHEDLFGGIIPQFAGRLRDKDYPVDVHFGGHNGVGHHFVRRSSTICCH